MPVREIVTSATLLRIPSSRTAESGLDVDEVVRDLRDTVAAIEATGQGVRGLAAPQIGHLVRVFVLAGYPEPFVDPAVEKTSDESTVEAEGCLSLPGVLIPVRRPKAIVLRSTTLGSVLDPTPTLRRWKMRGRDARAALHERDHLVGRLIVDADELGRIEGS